MLLLLKKERSHCWAKSHVSGVLDVLEMGESLRCYALFRNLTLNRIIGALMSKVKSMNKVSVVVNSIDTALNGSPREPVRLSFIYGIGRDGLSPFECCLEGRGLGDHVELTVKGSEVAESFGGLFPLVRGFVDGLIRPEVMKFNIEILGIEEVDNREVVAALASTAAGCGSGGSGDSCDCGCS